MNSLNKYKQHKILVLHGTTVGNEYLVLHGTTVENEYVDNAEIYRKVNSFTKILKKLHEHVAIPFKEIWYENWKQAIKDYDVIIIFDVLRGRDVIKYIHNVNPTARIIIYYINKFRQGARNDPDNFKDLPCELWSFDKNDCERVKMNYNHFCYNDSLCDEENRKSFYNKENIGQDLCDAFFIGVDKNRLGKLVELKALLEKYQYKTNIILRKAKNVSYKNLTVEESSILTERDIKYKDIIKFIHQSKCIIEIQDTNQNGLTLRPMEAMFFKKKLITDNLDVLNYNFYKKENIFILGYDKEERLENFLLNQYEPVDDAIIQQYTWEAWLDRFFN